MKYLLLLFMGISSGLILAQSDSTETSPNLPPPPPARLINVEVINQDVKLPDDIPNPGPESTEDSLLFVVDSYPVFPGCDSILYEAEQRKCTIYEIEKHCQDNTVFPDSARFYGLDGKVQVHFTINKKGFVEDVQVVRSVNKWLDNAAIAAVKTLPKMSPALKDEKPVKIKFVIPLNFKLD